MLNTSTFICRCTTRVNELYTSNPINSSLKLLCRRRWSQGGGDLRGTENKSKQESPERGDLEIIYRMSYLAESLVMILADSVVGVEQARATRDVR